MTGARKRHVGPTLHLTGPLTLGESHLLPDAVVAFVDGELSPDAHERAAGHLTSCRDCAAEVDAQRSARAAVHSGPVPSIPAGLLASLESIPDSATLSTTPDNLAVSEDGQLVAVQRPQSTPLGTAPLGSNALGARTNRRAISSAGVVMSGLVAGAVALALSAQGNDSPDQPSNDAGGVQQASFDTGHSASPVDRLMILPR